MVAPLLIAHMMCPLAGRVEACRNLPVEVLELVAACETFGLLCLQGATLLAEGVAWDFVSGNPKLVPGARRSLSGSPCVQFSQRNTTGDKRGDNGASTRNCVECNEGESGKGLNAVANYISQFNVESFINENVPLHCTCH